MWIGKEDLKCGSYRITCPGTYKLRENISFNPKSNKVAAITIDASSVVLDLNGHVLSQSSKNKQSQVTGILVKTGHKKVTILGSYGTIKNFSQRGIYVEGGNSFVTIGDETLLTVTGCGYGTPVALLDGTEPILQAGIQLGDIVFFVKFGFGQYHGILTETRVVNVASSQNNVGIGLGEGTNYTFINSSFSFNVENRLINPTIVSLGGFYLPNSVVCYGFVYISNPELDTPTLKSFGVTDITFQGCKFNSNVADATITPNAAGAYTDSFFCGANTKNLKFLNCQFNSNNAKIANSGIFNKTRGCTLSSGYGTVFEDCEFSGNIGGATVNGLNVSGLIASDNPLTRDNFQSESTTIRRCVASRNIATVDLQQVEDYIEVLGFSIRYPSGLTIEDCTIEDNISTLTANSLRLNAFADGIIIFSDPTYPTKFANNIAIKNCKISRNRVTFALQGKSSGIRVLDDLCENIVIQNNVITENWKVISDPVNEGYEVQGAGIDLFNESGEKTGPSYVSVLSNVIKSNAIYGIYTNLDYTDIQNNDIQNHDVGIDIDLYSCGNFVSHNKVLQSYLFGIHDENVPSTSFIENNTVFGSGTPYFVEYPGGFFVPVVEGSISTNPAFYPPLPTVSSSNIAMLTTECPYGPVLKRASRPPVLDKESALRKLHKIKHSIKQFKK